MCKILRKWMSINFYFSSWSHCRCRVQWTQGVDLPDVSVLALERGSAVTRHQNMGAQQKCLLLRSCWSWSYRQCLGATLGSCHLFNQWVLVMRCVGWGTVQRTVHTWVALQLLVIPPHGKCHAEQTALGSGLLPPILAGSQGSCTQGHGLTMNMKS